MGVNDALSQPRATGRIPRFFQSAWKLPLVVAAGTLVWAALAADPTHAGLDALLHQKAQMPFLSFWDSAFFGGQYQVLVVLPVGYPAGSITLRGREVATGKPVYTVHGNMSIVPLGNVCSVAGCLLSVLSCEENEFYATEWEIWFTPEEGGAPRCIGRQEFLIMGGDSW